MAKGERRWSNQKEPHESDQYEELSDADIREMREQGLSPAEIQAAIDYQNGDISGSGWASQRPVSSEGSPWEGGGNTTDHFTPNKRATTKRK